MAETIIMRINRIQKNNPKAGRILLETLETIDDMNYFIQKL